MKSIRSFLFGVGIIFIVSNFLHAQDAATPDATAVAAMTDTEVLLQAVEQTPPMPPDEATNGSTFWSVQHAPGTADEWPPTPMNPGLNAWSLGGGSYLLDDRNYVWGRHHRKTNLSASSTSIGGMQTLTMMSSIDLNPGDGGDDTNSDGGDYIPPTFTGGTPIDTNGLWLQIFCVTNGTAALALNNATDYVYLVQSTVALVNGSNNWSIETELFPTNGTTQTNTLPFTLPQGSRTNALFLRATDWTGVTTGTNQTPSWWFYYYFGTTALFDTNLDSQGNTLLSDYQNTNDPNVIQFSVSVTNNYVNTTIANLQLNITAGNPSYYAVLVNDTNMADASWQPCTGSSLSVYLGSSDGNYNVQVGLRGLPANATQTWQSVALTKDTVAPLVTITNPIITGGNAATVSMPMIQLQGFASKNLGSLTFDVSNAVGTVMGQQGFVTDTYFDKNAGKFTTNYFQCFDIPLTNGLNQIRLHAADYAGNATTTSFNISLDYSNASPPVFNFIWPQNGDKVSGSQFTLTGQMDDWTATVAASLADTNGVTNSFSGLVERDGKVWIENLPLNPGTNVLTVTATDAAGMSATTNLTVINIPLALTVNDVPDDQLNGVTVPDVRGTINLSGYTVWVNGVKATNNGDGTWDAYKVPLGTGGTAVIQARAIPNTDNGGNGGGL